jgi:hypothetical protein
VDLHLDDRLLHGRILHGWAPLLRPRRFVLAARELPGSQAAALFAAGAVESGAGVLCCDPWAGAPLPPALPGDFWLAASAPAAARLLAAGLAVERLVIIGLREAAGRPLAPDFAPSPASVDVLAAIAAGGIGVLIQRFPGEPGTPLAPLLAAAAPEGD